MKFYFAFKEKLIIRQKLNNAYNSGFGNVDYFEIDNLKDM